MIHHILILVSLFFATVVTGSCQDNEIEVAYTRINRNESAVQSFVISNPSTESILYSASGATPNTTESRTICLLQTENLQYTLILNWAITTPYFIFDGSNVAFYGRWGNLIFRSNWINLLSVFTLSFYSPITEDSTWHYTTNVPLGWMVNSAFTSWPHSANGQFEAQTSVLYLRTTFSGMDLIAAYECQFFYKEGIAVYLNGVEVYRDNLPKGVLHPFIKVINSYSIADYRNVIRVGNEIKRGENHLAVVLYFQSSSSQSSFVKTLNYRMDEKNSTTPISTNNLTVNGMKFEKTINRKESYQQQKQQQQKQQQQQQHSLHSSRTSLKSSAHINYFSRIACYASSLPLTSDTNICYPVNPPTVLAGGLGPTSYLTDFNLESLIFMTVISPTYYIHYDIPPSQVNKFLSYYSIYHSTVTQISLKSRESIQSDWTTEILSDKLSQAELLTGGQAVFQFPTYPHSPYSQHRIIPQATSGSVSIMIEMIPLVCYQSIERKRVTLSLQPNYTWAVGDEVNVRATEDYDKECFVDGNLPVGLTMTVGCGILGNLTEVISPYSIIIYWEDELGTQSMEITMEVKPQPRSLETSTLGMITVIVIMIMIVLCICIYLLYRKKRKTTKTLPKHKDISKPPGHIELTSRNQVIINPSVIDPNNDPRIGNGQEGNQSTTTKPSLQSPGTTPSVPFSSNSIHIPYAMDSSVSAINNVITSSYSDHTSSGSNKLYSTPNSIGQGNSNSLINSYTLPGQINIIPTSATGNYSIPPPSDSNSNNTIDPSANTSSNHNHSPPKTSISVNSDINSNGFATSHISSMIPPPIQKPPSHPLISNHSNSTNPIKIPTSSTENNTASTSASPNQQQQQLSLRPPPLSHHLQQLQQQKQQQHPLRPPPPSIHKQPQYPNYFISSAENISLNSSLSPSQQPLTSSSSSSHQSNGQYIQSLPTPSEQDQGSNSQQRVSLLSAPSGPQPTERSKSTSLSSNSQENLRNGESDDQTSSILSNSVFTSDVGATSLPLSISERQHQQLLKLQQLQQQQQQPSRMNDSVIANKSTISSKVPLPNPMYPRLPLPPRTLPRNNNPLKNSMLRPVPHPYGTLIHHNPSVNSNATHIDDRSISSGK